MKKYFLLIIILLLTSCWNEPQKHQINPGAQISIYEVTINDFHDLFPSLPNSSAATFTKDGKIEVYLTRGDSSEIVRESIHEFMHVHSLVMKNTNIKFTDKDEELRYTLKLMSSPGNRWDAAKCGPVKQDQ